MLLNEKTKEKFGYLATELSKGSKKMVVVICDYCQKELEVVNRNMINGKEFVDKDCCWGCRHKKSEDVNLVKYGTKNQFSRKEIKEKIVETNQEKYGVDHFTQAEEFKEKTKETCLEKYGTEHANQAEEVKEKIRATNLDRYGNEYAFNSPEIKAKSESTNMERYGTKNYLSSEEGKKKVAATNLEKYGAENPFGSKEIQEKIKKINMEKYGVEYPMQSDEILDKAKKTNLEKYGVENVFKHEPTKEKIKQTNLDKYGCEFATQNPEIKDKMRQTWISTGRTKTFSGKTIRELSETSNQCYHTFRWHVANYGIDYALSFTAKENGLERLVIDMLDRNDIDYVQHAVVNSRKTDFLLENGTVIEADGNYYHSDEVLKDRKYHVIKQRAYSDAGCGSMFFREHEIKNRPEIVESIIMSNIGKSDKLYAKNCRLQPLRKKTAKAFFINNHLIGNGSGDSYGLFHGKVLVSVLQISNKSNGIYRISRFCDKIRTEVIGGFSRLLEYVEKNINMSQLFGLADLRYETGNNFIENGFVVGKTYLNYRWTNSKEERGKKKFPNDTGYDYGYAKIWDCGQKKFTKTYRVPQTEEKTP